MESEPANHDQPPQSRPVTPPAGESLDGKNAPPRRLPRQRQPSACPCPCATGGFCGGCGHTGCRRQ
ncbi:MAG: hypothetical protein QG597_2299 [Actinomycetota bacterium]|nr:hypothetical protein [Actinomycetota bacterium]